MVGKVMYNAFASELNNTNVTVIERNNIMLRVHTSGEVEIGYTVTGDLYNFTILTKEQSKELLSCLQSTNT